MDKSQQKISQASEKDNKNLLQLTKECPMKGEIEVFTDRSPSFFTIYKMLDDKFNLFVERKNHKLSACMGSLHRMLYINDRPHNIAFWGDLKVAPEFRKGLSAIKLIRSVIDSDRRSGVKFALASVIRGNKESLIFTEGRAGIPKAELLGNFTLFNVLPVFKLKPDMQFQISNALDSNIPEMVRFYNDYYSKHNFSPRFTDSYFRKMINDFPGLAVDNFKIARKNDRIEAIVACWDQKYFQKYILVSYNISFRILRSLLLFLRLFGKTPAIPEKNRPLKFIYICFAAVRDKNTEALKALLRIIHNEIRGSEYSHFSICLNENDQMVNTLKGMISGSLTSHLFLYPLEQNIAAYELKLNEKPVHAEYALLI